MSSLRKYTLVGILLGLFLIASGCDALPGTAGEQDGLRASGVVETVSVAVAPEVGGRIVEIFVAEGVSVQEGDLLFRLDDELLQSQRQQAVARLESTQIGLAIARSGLEMAEAALKTAEASAEMVAANAEVEQLLAQKALADLYQTHEVARSEAYSNVASAGRALREAQYRLDNFTVSTKQRDMAAMEALEEMQARLDEARQAFEPYKYADSNDARRQDLRDDLDEAQSDYDAALRRLEYETDLETAKALYNKALHDLEILETGPDPEDIAVLEARITAAETAPGQALAVVEQSEVGITQAQAQVDQADKAIAQAQATLNLFDTQMDQLSVKAAVSGVIMVQNIHLGEILQPGAVAMTIGQLDELTVTVYIAEDRYGQISLGDQTQVTVDSFPGETFDAVVTRIADRAEYTPRNVQTQEERSTTVFAIELSLNAGASKLKPGMPADVDFNQQ